jgi:hypothetical protein
VRRFVRKGGWSDGTLYLEAREDGVYLVNPQWIPIKSFYGVDHYERLVEDGWWEEIPVEEPANAN